MCVGGRPTDGERVHDEIHPPTEELHRLLQHGDVPLDGPIRGLIRRRQPVDGEKSVQSAVAQRHQLALVTSVVDDRRGGNRSSERIRSHQRLSTPMPLIGAQANWAAIVIGRLAGT